MNDTARIVREINYSAFQLRGDPARLRGGASLRERQRLDRPATPRARLQGGRGSAQLRSVKRGRDGVNIEVIGGTLRYLPTAGSLVVVANHPYGILDCSLMGRILSELVGGDFKIMAHQVFRRAPELDRILLRVDLSEAREAGAQHLGTRAEALRYLCGGGGISVFPGGTVSTATRLLGPPLDLTWRSFPAKMIARSEAAVAPLFFDGHNSRLFRGGEPPPLHPPPGPLSTSSAAATAPGSASL